MDNSSKVMIGLGLLSTVIAILIISEIIDSTIYTVSEEKAKEKKESFMETVENYTCEEIEENLKVNTLQNEGMLRMWVIKKCYSG